MPRVVLACRVLALCSLAWAVIGGLGGAAWWWAWLGAPPSAIWPVVEGIEAGTLVGQWLMLAGVAAVVPRRAVAGLLVADVVAQAWLLAPLGLGPAAVGMLPAGFVLIVALLDRPAPPQPRHGRAPWLLLACAWFLLSGVVILVDFQGPVFALYREYLVGLDPAPSWSHVELGYARIAVGFSVHYAAVAVALRHRGPTAGVLRAAAVAQLGWMLVDSPTGLAHGAAFNVLMINVPAFVLFAAAWAVTWRASTRT